MKVKELIKQLKEYDPDLVVSLKGYEGGLTDKIELDEVDVFLNVNTRSYLGEHGYKAEWWNEDLDKNNVEDVRIVLS